jgi:hypothetical protein
MNRKAPFRYIPAVHQVNGFSSELPEAFRSLAKMWILCSTHEFSLTQGAIFSGVKMESAASLLSALPSAMPD